MSLVLLAEDEEAMLGILADVVEDLGHRTMRAQNGEEALLLARTERPDLVISDHMMPQRTGVQLLREFRADPTLAPIPFLLISAARPEGLEEAEIFLPKPVDINTFESAVRRALGVSGALPEREDRRRAAKPHRMNDAIREEMFNWLAHEIKTPLGAARMSAQLLIRQLYAAGAPDLENKHATAIIRQLDRINALITSILDAAQLSEGKIALRVERRDLVAFVQEVIGDWKEFQPHAAFTVLSAEERIELSFDADRLRQILNNLLSNAVKYGGPDKRVEVTVSSSPGLAVVEVRDWGVGIAAAKLHAIFDRFHRAESAEGRGHGLGLFIADALIRLHGGTLAARSELGKGSTFTLRLPKARST